jgi:hypothetical protein
MPLPVFKLTLAAAAAYYLFSRSRKARLVGSPTNASQAVDDIDLSAESSSEEILDAGVEGTFPASDPVSVDNAYETAYEREQRRKQPG